MFRKPRKVRVLSMGRGKSGRQKRLKVQQKQLESKQRGLEARQQRFEERVASSWVSRMRLDDAKGFVSIISWNILAESYCWRRSHRNLRSTVQREVFDSGRRRQHVKRTLSMLVTQNKDVDVVCLQEVDRPEVVETMRELGYSFYASSAPMVVEGGGAGGKADAVYTFVNDKLWTIEEELLVRFDELAHGRSDGLDSSSYRHLQGIQHSFLRRNAAVLVRIRNRQSGKTAVIANAHLYWNPAYEYVKLCQAHYLLLKAEAFKKTHTEPFMFAGDLNSKPNGITHTYLVRGWVDARLVAPWCHHEPTAPSETDSLSETLANLSIKAIPAPRYILDATLNKMCRWLRILGVDVALETDAEEVKRTGSCDMVIFERCRKESRTLVSTSRRLVARRDCPNAAYFVSAPFLATNETLETVLVHMLLTHGVELDPAKFLSRCIVCNGKILQVHEYDEKRKILKEYEAPSSLVEEGLEVYKCDCCCQGYWWNDLPTSSASRVKYTATRLFELCLRAGVKCKPDLGMFDEVDVEKLRAQGWDGPAVDLLSERMDAIDWLHSERLESPLKLRSAYDGDIPFTNVTYDFVDTLDYILYESNLCVKGILHTPKSFEELADGVSERNAHLLPSDVWPSDHLAIGARLDIQRCNCGCVPNIPGLFEMAQLRKEYQKTASSSAPVSSSSSVS